MALLLLVIYWGVGRLTQEYVISRLKHDAETIISAFEQSPDNQKWTLNQERVDAVYQRAYSGHYFVIRAPSVDVRSRSLWDFQQDIPDHYAGGQDLIEGPSDQLLLVWSQVFSKKNTDFTIWVAEDMSPINELKLRYSLWAVLIVVCGALGLIFLQQRILMLNFERLKSVREKIQAFRYSEEKPDLSTVPIELIPLAEDIDQLLHQLKKKVSRSRYALGNLAHEIKRPLQRVQQIIEQMPAAEHAEISRLLDDIQWLIQRELKRARIVGVSSPGRQTDLSEDVDPLIQVLNKLYSHIHLTVHYPAHLVLWQDRDDMLELLGNLLDNACKFAHSEVGLTIETKNQVVLIKITDDGESLAEADIERLMMRGQRLDERVQGSGLGLAICQDIVENYDGTFFLEKLAAGGIQATVSLPMREGSV